MSKLKKPKFVLPKVSIPTIQSKPKTTTAIRQPRPVFTRYIVIITRKIEGIRVHVKTLKVNMKKGDFFHFKGRAFYIDPSKAFMVSNKGIYVMYEMNVTEPLDTTQLQQPIEPEKLGDSVHWSSHVEMLTGSNMLRQLVASLGNPSSINLMTWVMLIVGAVMGFFMGQVFPVGLAAKTATTITTTTSTTTSMTSTIHSMYILLRWCL